MSDESLDIVIEEAWTDYGVSEPIVPPSIHEKAQSIVETKEGVAEERLISSLIDDFIFESIEHGVLSEERIAERFQDSGILEELDNAALELGREAPKYKELVQSGDFEEVNKKIVSTLEKWGVPADKLGLVRNVEVNVTTGTGASSASVYSGNSVELSGLQLLRKSGDFITVYGDSYELEGVYRTLMLATYAHEVGHRVDRILGIPSNNIPFEWGNNDDGYMEHRPERFAEAFGRLVLDEQQNDIREREWDIQLQKTTRLWEGVRKAKETNKDFNLKKTFALIREVIPEGSPTGRFIDARRDLYTTFPIEEYSLPYGMDTLESVIRESLG